MKKQDNDSNLEKSIIARVEVGNYRYLAMTENGGFYAGRMKGESIVWEKVSHLPHGIRYGLFVYTSKKH